MKIEIPPWHEDQHGTRWNDDAYVALYLKLYWDWLPKTIIANPPNLPFTYGEFTFQPGYFEKLLERKATLNDARSVVRLAETRRLAYELWLWRQWDLSKA